MAMPTSTGLAMAESLTPLAASRLAALMALIVLSSTMFSARPTATAAVHLTELSSGALSSDALSSGALASGALA